MRLRLRPLLAGRRNSAVQYIFAALAGILALVLMLDVVGLSAALA